MIPNHPDACMSADSTAISLKPRKTLIPAFRLADAQPAARPRLAVPTNMELVSPRASHSDFLTTAARLA